jgi:hypothetical protein
MRQFFSLLIVLIASGPALAVDLDGDLYRNQRIGLKFTAPPGWLISRQTGYPEIVALMTTKTDREARLSVALDAIDRNTPLRKVVAQNNLAMRAVGIQIKSSGRVERLGRQVWRTLARATRHDKSEMAIQQIYLQANGRVFILTLSCPTRALKQHLPALDSLLDSMDLPPAKG